MLSSAVNSSWIENTMENDFKSVDWLFGWPYVCMDDEPASQSWLPELCNDDDDYDGDDDHHQEEDDDADVDLASCV